MIVGVDVDGRGAQAEVSKVNATSRMETVLMEHPFILVFGYNI